MGKLVYLMNVSLDGYVETPDRGLDWTVVDDEVHAWFNEQERSTEASLYGRRIYEVMTAYWPTGATDPAGTPVTREFARIWNAKPHLVFSRTLTEVHPTSELVPGDDIDEAYRRIRRRFDGDLNVCGPTLAAQFIERGLVDEYRVVIHPVILGAGRPYLPPLTRPIGLRLVDRHSFESGAIAVSYAAR